MNLSRAKTHPPSTSDLCSVVCIILLTNQPANQPATWLTDQLQQDDDISVFNLDFQEEACNQMK